jgi:hypothetical protein
MAKHNHPTIRERLAKHMKRGEVIEILREPIDPWVQMAIVLALSADLVLLHDVTELESDGYKIVRLRDVSSVEYMGSEKFYERILREEGIVTEVRPPFKIDLSNWKSAIGSIQKRSRPIIIEDENPENPIFLIGKVRRLTTRTVAIRHFDSAGRWELSDRVMRYSQITAVGFDDRYSTLYCKYAYDAE